MRAHILLKQYVWLVETINRARRITLADLNERWQNSSLSDGKPLSRTSFNRHREAVEELFGIKIECDNDNRYHIVDNDLIHSDTVQQWMLSTLTVSNIVGEVRKLHDRILLENIPSEGELLQDIVNAMQRSVQVAITYQRYGHDIGSSRVVEPYCIKLFRRRWYLLCRTEKRGFMVLSFDRIKTLKPTEKTFFIDPDFNAESFFSEYFGVMTDDSTPLQRIVLRAYGNERFALRDLPIHHTQKELEATDDYVDFEIRLRPTSDFKAHILSRGRWVEVISPDKLAHEIKTLHQEAIEVR